MTREFLKNCNIPSVGKPVISQVFFYFHRIKNTMTTTQNYNPLRNALVELTTTEALRWYRTQAKTTATLAQTIAHYSFTTAQRLLSDRYRFAIAPAIAEPENAKVTQQNEQLETVEGDRLKHFPGLRIGNTPEEQLELNQPAMDLLQSWIETDKISVAESENAIAPSEAETIAPATAPEPDDSEGDRIAIDEPEQAMLTLQESASTELQQAKAPHQEYALSEAETKVPEHDFGDAIAGETDAELSWVEDAPLDDEDPTERRYWAGVDAEVVASPVLSYQEEDDAEALAGDEA
jgi:hypothetical protein